MDISRRRFVTLMTLLGFRGAFPLDAKADSQAGASLSYEEVRARLASTKLFWIPYTHNDYGWLTTHRWDLERLSLAHKEALEIMRHDLAFKCFIDTEFEGLAAFLNRYPEMFDELKQRIKEGRWGVAPGSFCNPENVYMEPEVMIRNLVLGRRDFESRFPGVNLEVAMFNDSVPGHSQIPQILTQAGYRFYRITDPVADLQKKGYKSEFLWEGLDRTEIVFSYGSYCWFGDEPGAEQRPNFAMINDYKANWEKAVVAFYESAARDSLAHSGTSLIYIPLGCDYSRPLRVVVALESEEPYIDVPGFVRKWSEHETVPLMFATPIDYFRELEKVKSSLPKVEGVIDVVGNWPFFYGLYGSKGIYNFRERNSRDLVEAEIFCSLANLIGAPYPGECIEALWYDALTLHPHGGLYLADEDIQDLLRVGQNVEYEARRLRTEAIEKLSQHIAVKPETQAIVLFNPLSWRRRELVEIHAVFPKPGTKRIKITDAEGRTLPHQLLEVRHMGEETLYYKDAMVLVEAQIPAVGYTTVYVEPEAGDEEVQLLDSPVLVLESGYARLRLGESGIEALEDKLHGTQYSGAGNPIYYLARDVSILHGGPLIGELRMRGATWTKIEDGPLRSTALMHARMGDHAVKMRVSLHHSVECVDFEVSLDSAGGSGYFAVAIPFEYEGSLTAGIPFGVEPRPLSREPFGDAELEANHFFAHHWVDYSGGGKGLTFLAAEGKPGFRFDFQTRTLAHVLLVTNIPRKPQLKGKALKDLSEVEEHFTNRYFRGTGTHAFTYALIPHGGDWREAQSLARAQERLYPARWNYIHYHRSNETANLDGSPEIRSRQGADLTFSKSFLSVNPETIALSSWLRKDDGHYIRLYESGGKDTDVTVTPPLRGASCASVDLNGKSRNSPQLSVQEDKVRFHMRPWEIVTLRFQTPDGFDKVPTSKVHHHWDRSPGNSAGETGSGIGRSTAAKLATKVHA